MNPTQIQNSIASNKLNAFDERTLAKHFDVYTDFKQLYREKKWSEILQPLDYKKPIEAKYHGSLPYDHGYYNEGWHRENAYKDKSFFIPPGHQIYELFPNKGTMHYVMKKRQEI